LSEAVLNLVPALEQQPHFLLSANERSQGGGTCGVQTIARCGLTQYLIDLDRMREAFE
jgi:hypothetical protein